MGLHENATFSKVVKAEKGKVREKKQAKAIGSLTDNFFPLGQVKKALKSKKSKIKSYYKLQHIIIILVRCLADASGELNA